jgi:glutaredoxin
MKGYLGLILVLGLVAIGYVKRDKIFGTGAKGGEGSPLQSLKAAFGVGAATPHPAQEAQAQAAALYPGLRLANSALNQKFLELYKEAKASDPALLARPDWPLELAERSVIALGSRPLPRGTAAARAGVAAAPGRVARQAKQVVVYTTSHCPYCTQAKQFLTEKGVRFREVNIEQSKAGKQEFRRLGGSGTPLIVVGSRRLQGFDAGELEKALF